MEAARVSPGSPQLNNCACRYYLRVKTVAGEVGVAAARVFLRVAPAKQLCMQMLCTSENNCGPGLSGGGG